MYCMKLIKAFWYFYKKLIIPNLIVNFVLFTFILFSINQPQIPTNEVTSESGYSFPVRLFCFSFVIFSILFQYFIYELKSPNEYYFYYNLGLGKPMLWSINAILSFFVGLSISMIWKTCMLTA